MALTGRDGDRIARRFLDGVVAVDFDFALDDEPALNRLLVGVNGVLDPFLEGVVIEFESREAVVQLRRTGNRARRGRPIVSRSWRWRWKTV